MAPDAGKVLGAPQIAGTFVSPRAHTQNMTARVAGVSAYEGPGAPDFGDIGFVALTADHVAIVKGKHGLFRPKVGSEVIDGAPRSEIVGAELDGGLLKADLRFRFADGSAWEFEVPKIYRKTAERVVRELGGSVS
jgi:hypothetical protein